MRRLLGRRVTLLDGGVHLTLSSGQLNAVTLRLSLRHLRVVRLGRGARLRQSRGLSGHISLLGDIRILVMFGGRLGERQILLGGLQIERCPERDVRSASAADTWARAVSSAAFGCGADAQAPRASAHPIPIIDLAFMALPLCY